VGAEGERAGAPALWDGDGGVEEGGKEMIAEKLLEWLHGDVVKVLMELEARVVALEGKQTPPAELPPVEPPTVTNP